MRAAPDAHAGDVRLVFHPLTRHALLQEVYERLVQELVTLENRADARLEASRRGGGAAQHPPLEADQKAYEALEKKLREMEAREDAPPAAAAMRRSTSRGALLPAESGRGDASGVHQRL